MRLIRPASFTVDDDVHPPVRFGAVSLSGESPNSTARLSVPDERHRRLRALDTLRHCRVVDNPDGTIKITGRSDYLADHIGAPRSDQIITVSVTPPKPCKDCPK